MPKVIPLNLVSKDQYLLRIAGLREDTPRLWGTMTALAMLAHLRRSFEMVLGKVPVEVGGNVLTRSKFFRWLMFEAMPWPQGKIKAPPVFFPEQAMSFEEEKQQTLALMGEFCEAAALNPDKPAPSPLMGTPPLRDWAKILGRHTDHHLQQFGL